jgi:hypothetical protein
MRSVTMRYLFLALIIAAIMPAAAREANKPTKKELQQLYSEYLREEGYKPEIDGDGDVVFKREGRVYFIAVSEKDPEFFRVVLANIWPIESEEERSQVLIAADLSNAKSKVAKVFTVKDDVWVSVELFLSSPADFKGVFNRSMSGIDYGTNEFVSAMREFREESEESPANTRTPTILRTPPRAQERLSPAAYRVE